MLFLLLAATSTATFGANGYVLGERGGLRAVAIDEEGRAVVAGWSGEAAAVLRYLEDGRPDPGFRSDLARVPGEGARFHGLAIDPTGRIVASGSADRRAIVARFLPDGSPDRSFGEAGVARGRAGASFLHERGGDAVDRFESVAIDSEGRIVVAGVARGHRPSEWSEWFFCGIDLRFCWSYENTSIVARFTGGGALDSSFAGAGFVLGKEGDRWHVGPHDELIEAIVLDGDRIAAAGWASGETYDDERTILARFAEDGGLEAFELSPPDSRAGGTKEVLYGLVRDGDRLIGCGFSFEPSRHIRALTKTYGPDLRLLSYTLADARQLADSMIEYFVKCAVDREGRIVAVGYTDDDWSYTEEPHRALLARSRAGVVERSFTSFQGGRSIFGSEKNDGFYDLAIDGAGRIWVAGSAGGRTLVARFTDELALHGGVTPDAARGP